MSFFFNEAKAAPRPAKKPTRARDIPIASLNQLGCSVCPRDKDKLRTPKMEPHGAENPSIYMLLPAPSLEDDEAGRYLKDKVGRFFMRALPRDLHDWRFNAIINCASDTVQINQHEIECCRGRVERDIEESRPLLILGVGDAPLSWATGLDGYAPKFRGKLITVKIGSHVCWYYPVNYPNFVFKESKFGPSEHEVALRHDLARLEDVINDLTVPRYEAGPYDAGIEIITGQKVGDLGRLERALADLASEPFAGLDLETTGLRPYPNGSKILTAACGTLERTVAFPLDHPMGWETDRPRRMAWELFTEWLLFSGKKECHNLGFELEWLSHEIDPRIARNTEWDDTMAMAHALDERPGTKSLEVQTIVNFGFNLKKQSLVDVSRPNWWLFYPIAEVLRYNGMDAKWTNALARRLRPVVEADPGNWAAYDRLVRLAPTLALTELKGLPVDLQFAQDMEARLDGETKAIIDKIQRTPEVIKYTRTFGRFEATNSDHVLKLMDKVCERDEIRRTTKDGTKLTSDEEALSEIPAREVPSAGLILEHRGLEKILSTYIRPLTTGRIIADDGKIHAKYSSMRTVTGRLAGEDPNPQNWPKRKHKEVRGVVAVDAARWILAADYGQIEFRVAGMASEDERLVKYCWTGYDVHSFWAQRMLDEYPSIKDWIVDEFEVDWDEKGMKTLRQEAKNKWVFPSIFGAAVRSRGANLHLPPEIAEALDREFWDEFPGVKKWQKKLLASYEKKLYVETLGGIRRHGPMSPNEIINMPIQGTAAEIVCEGMNAISERALIEDDPDIQPMLNVHDDLSFDPTDEHLERTIDVVAYEMCKPRFAYINVPLIVEVSVGPRWNELKEIGVFSSEKLFNLRNPFK